TKKFNLTLQNVVPGTYIIEEYVVNRHYGSAFDVWSERFDGEEPFTLQAMEELKKASVPKYSMKKLVVNETELHYSAMLEPHEIRLVLMKRL
ncbi:MAG: hypothetical protein ACI4QR_01565, partial [Eubacteriales bacterium]